jgi:hypothetical protein
MSAFARTADSSRGSRHKAVLDRIAGAQEDNGNGLGGRLGCQGRVDAVGVDYRNLSVDELGDHDPETIFLTFGPAVFKCDVVAFDVACFL